jgi:hypothetical protein
LNRHEKWAREESLYVKLKLNTLVFLNVPTDKNLKGLRSGEHGGCYSKTICKIYINFLPCFGVGNSLLKLLEAYFIYTLYTVYKCGCGQIKTKWQAATGWSPCAKQPFPTEQS